MEHERLIQQWKNGLRIRHMAYSMCFSRYRKLDRMIGLLSTIFAAVVATTIFASLSESDDNTLIIIAGTISVAAALLSASHSFLNYSELSEKHRQAAASFGSLRRELEALLLDKTITSTNSDLLKSFNERWSELELTSPAIPQRIYDKAHDVVNKE